MKKGIIILFFLFFLFFLFIPSKAFAADVVLNEIFANPVNENEEFIELFNNTDSEISLANWKISDKVKTYIITSQNIAAKGFLVIQKATSALELNNSDEDLTLKNASDSTIDSFSYDSAIEGKSFSRVPDGTGAFANNTNTTEGAANSAPPTIAPTQSPTPTSNPSNTPAPTATKTPTPAPTSAPTGTPAPTPTPKKGTPTPTQSVMTAQNTNTTQQIKGVQSNPQPTDVVDLGGKLDSLEASKEPYNWWKLLIIMGTVIVTGTSCLFMYNSYLKDRKTEESV